MGAGASLRKSLYTPPLAEPLAPAFVSEPMGNRPRVPSRPQLCLPSGANKAAGGSEGCSCSGPRASGRRTADSRLLALMLGLSFLSAAQSQDAARERGLALISQGKLREASAVLRQACEQETPPGDSCYFWARNLQTLSAYAEARPAFERALRHAPPALLPRVHRAAGLNEMALGNDTEAERHLRRAVARASGGSEDPRVDLGAFLFRQGRLKEAEPLLEAAAAAPAAPVRALLEYGRLLLQTGRPERAVSYLEEVVARTPEESNPHLLLGRAYQRLGRMADAERELQRGQDSWRRKQAATPPTPAGAGPP